MLFITRIYYYHANTTACFRSFKEYEASCIHVLTLKQLQLPSQIKCATCFQNLNLNLNRVYIAQHTDCFHALYIYSLQKQNKIQLNLYMKLIP